MNQFARSTQGSASVMGLGVIIGVMGLAASIMIIIDVVRFAEFAQRKADLAALAGSDVSIGVVSGHPCRVAASTLSGSPLRLESCEVDRGSARIVVSGVRHGLTVRKLALAAPSPGPIWGDLD